MRLLALAGCMALFGCGGTSNQMVASLYEVSPEQCETVRAAYMDEVVNPLADFGNLDRLSCQMNKCAALSKLLEGGEDLSSREVDDETRFRYAPAALGGENCDAIAMGDSDLTG